MATVKVAGPFRIDSRPYPIPATNVLVATGAEPGKPRNGAVVVVMGIVAVAAAGLVIYRKKQGI